MTEIHPFPMLWLRAVTVTTVNAYPLREVSGEAYVRRSILQSEDGSSLSANGGFVSVENSVIGPAAASLSITSLYTHRGAVIDVQYSVIAGGDPSVFCLAGEPTNTSGAIRNSIVMPSWVGEAAGEYCDAINMAGNAGVDLGYQPLWFTDAPDDFHLSAAGAAAAGRVAQWEVGDPLFDVDGDPRPQTSLGYPGIDEP